MHCGGQRRHSSISASSLTTISGLAAMMFMQFQIGFDMGIVLIKSILFSMLSVFTLMPGLLMLFSKAMERTRHRSFIPRIDRWGGFVLKLRHVGVPLFIVALVGAFSSPTGAPMCTAIPRSRLRGRTSPRWRSSGSATPSAPRT